LLYIREEDCFFYKVKGSSDKPVKILSDSYLHWSVLDWYEKHGSEIESFELPINDYVLFFTFYQGTRLMCEYQAVCTIENRKIIKFDLDVVVLANGKVPCTSLTCDSFSCPWCHGSGFVFPSKKHLETISIVRETRFVFGNDN